METPAREMYGNLKKSISVDIDLTVRVSECCGLQIAGKRKIFLARTITKFLFSLTFY